MMGKGKQGTCNGGERIQENVINHLAPPSYFEASGGQFI